jgi:hypothetical protein
MGRSKVVFAGETLIDLTEDTVDPSKLISGFTAHDRSGQLITGVAAGEASSINSLEEFLENYDSENGFLISYNNVTTGITYVTNTQNTSKGILMESTSENDASVWYLEKVSGYTDRFSIYTKIDGENYYIYNNTSAGANFIGLDTTEKMIFIVSEPEEARFLFKDSTANKWLQHSNGGGGIRLYTDHNNANNTQFIFTYRINAIVPYGTLTITENGTYDITNYKRVIVNIS